MRVACPSVVLPSLKVTVPVGTPEPEVFATVAVKVIDVPDVAFAVDAVSVVDVAAREGAALTTMVIAVEVLALKFESPE